MVIRYEPIGPIDSLTCRTLVEVAEAIPRPLVVGAWMTRLWALAFGAAPPRLTSDVDVGAEPELVDVAEAAKLLQSRGYKRDEQGYPFRYTRMTREGVLIVDMLVDSGAARPDESALPVFGLAAGAKAQKEFQVELVGIGTAAIRVPSLDGAVLLRALALADGPTGLKFQDYAVDAVLLGQLLTESPEDFLRWKGQTGEAATRAREIVLPLFASERAPGALAVGTRASGDPTLAARRASSTFAVLYP
jgi:hypothetical protein